VWWMLLGSAMAVLQSQAGVNDWHRQLVGKLRFRFQQRGVLVVGSEANVLAGIRIRTGDLLWRQILEEEVVSIIETPPSERTRFCP